MCYQVDVIYNEDKALLLLVKLNSLLITTPMSSVEEGFDDCWSYSRECHYTRPNGKYEVDAMTRLNSLYVIVHEDGDEMLDIHITTTLDKMLVKN